MNELTEITAGLNIEFDSSMHIGAGRGDVAVNRIVKRTAAHQPYVPASALKGALRMAAEQLMAMTATGDSEAHLVRKGTRVLKGVVCRGPDPRSMCQSKRPCLVCRVFGNGWTGRRLLVDDALAVEDKLYKMKKKTFTLTKAKWEKEIEAGRLSTEEAMQDITMQHEFELDRFAATDKEILTRVHINRKRRGAAAGHLFSSEYTPAHVFSTKLSGWVPLSSLDEGVPPPELVLLAASIRFVNQIGGEASTGHGACRISIVEKDEKGKEIEGKIYTGNGGAWTREELIEYLDFLPFYTGASSEE